MHHGNNTYWKTGSPLEGRENLVKDSCNLLGRSIKFLYKSSVMCRRILCYYPLTTNFIFKTLLWKTSAETPDYFVSWILIKICHKGVLEGVCKTGRGQRHLLLFICLFFLSVSRKHRYLTLAAALYFNLQLFLAPEAASSAPPALRSTCNSCQCLPRSESQLFKTIPLILGISTNWVALLLQESESQLPGTP